MPEPFAAPGPVTPEPPAMLVVAGPTASGKSALALALAERSGGEIVSCDSVAVYRGFDIGTAKPSPAERARVPHHLLDVVDAGEPFSAARFVELADVAIADCHRRRVPVIVSGGTALYLKALLEGLFSAPPPDPALRARLKREAAELGWPALHARLAAVDPAAAARIAPRDPVRIERALEVYQQTGVPLSVHHAAQARSAPRHQALVVVLDPPPAALAAAIVARAERMLAAGLVDETRRLLAEHGRACKPLGSLGYAQAVAHLDGRLEVAALAPAIAAATRQFARRQRTFFRKAFPPAPGPPEVRWLDGEAAIAAGELGKVVDRLWPPGPDSPRC